MKPRSCELAYYKNLTLEKQNPSPFIVISLLILPHSWQKLTLEKKPISPFRFARTSFDCMYKKFPYNLDYKTEPKIIVAKIPIKKQNFFKKFYKFIFCDIYSCLLKLLSWFMKLWIYFLLQTNPLMDYSAPYIGILHHKQLFLFHAPCS